MSVLESAMAEIQREEFEARKHNDFDYAEGLHRAFDVLVDAESDYVTHKANRNPLWRLWLWLRYKKASMKIRDLKI